MLYWAQVAVCSQINTKHVNTVCHNTESLYNHTTTVHKEREHLGDRRNAGESSCNSGDGTGQMAQPLMFMIIMMNTVWTERTIVEF
jgi:hypothetical protein